eukprot:CAMPEP_0181537616 /NCGR_PEP_ID=MMETSP1110-20121109/75443_1 /TAXON_ID=174948 /ORGANISM="Symbiodinium sp., Strain CCMP421" /LENGTH=82 /DNA_ID=CAMNT_0023669193 /DNA_START=270 /DNA_END=518 /DNA_ORIENTATION=+
MFQQQLHVLLVASLDGNLQICLSLVETICIEIIIKIIFGHLEELTCLLRQVSRQKLAENVQFVQAVVIKKNRAYQLEQSRGV